jgi:hypothetical protein
MYEWKTGTRYAVAAEDAAVELERIRNTFGDLNPEAIVRESSPTDAALHSMFTWNNRAAADKWRTQEARKIVRALVVVDEQEDQQPVYVHVNTEDRPRYEPIEIVVKSVDLYTSALSELEAQMNGLKTSLDQLKQAAGHSDQPERMARITIAVSTARALEQAIGALH